MTAVYRSVPARLSHFQSLFLMFAVFSSTDVPRPVLQSISLEIRAGQRVVLTGRTGR